MIGASDGLCLNAAGASVRGLRCLSDTLFGLRVHSFPLCIYSGKSYTMEGHSQDRGLNYRALTEVFSSTCESNPRKAAGVSYKISLAVVEIYNETIRDLLYANQKENRKSVRERERGKTHDCTL